MRLPPVTAGFRRLARLREARAFHPVGRVGHGRLLLDRDDSALARALGAGEHEVTVRLSRGIGLPSASPDLLGLAIRVERPAPAQDPNPGPEPFDLLLTTTGRTSWARRLVLPARRWTSRPYSTVLPYDTGEGNRTTIVLAAAADWTPDASPEALDAVTSQRPLAFDVHETHRGPHPVGRLIVDQVGPDTSIAFDPMLHARPRLRPVRPLATLREAAYRGSRKGREH